MKQKAIIIGGASSGSGKTTLTMGLLKVLTKRGYRVQPYKVGPDYIDPMFHRYIAKSASYNLSASLVDEAWLKFLFHQHFNEKDIAVIEGVMGYYDGADVGDIEGSTAHIANVLNVDALIIFDASSMALSAAALVSGFEHFKGHQHVKGVIFNNVRSDHHYSLLKEAVEKHTSVKAYGYLPPMADVALKSRHLGLIQAIEVDHLSDKIDHLADQMEKTVNISSIIEDFDFEGNPSHKQVSLYEGFVKKWQERIKANRGLRIGIAQDEAFSFYYQDNLELLEACGITLVPFSPLHDNGLVEDLDGLYIGGGYPEVFAEKLSMNKSFLNEIKEKVEQSCPVYAECGGLMYLTKAIETLEGKVYDMVGVYDATTHMTKRLQRFGYVSLSLNGHSGQTLSIKAHEFHKSICQETSAYQKAYKIYKKDKEWADGLIYKKCLAAYPHIHFYSNLNFLDYLLNHFVNV